MAADGTLSALEFIILLASTCLASCIKVSVICIYMSTNHEWFQTDLIYKVVCIVVAWYLTACINIYACLYISYILL